MKNANAEDEKKRRSLPKRRKAMELKEIKMEKITIDREMVESSTNAINEYKEAILPDDIDCELPKGFKIKEFLTLDEAITFVEAATESYFPQGDYSEFVGDVATAILAVETYTNLELPEDVSEKYAVILAKHLVPIIERNVNYEQYYSLVDSIDENVKERRRLSERNIEKELDKISLLFENIAGNTEDIMNSLDVNDVKTLLSATSEGKIDEEKLVKAYSKIMLNKDNEAVDTE